MPRIEAPTVAEHRKMRYATVVDNAARLLLEGGPAAVTPAAVAEASGLARSSVYQYFGTSGELVGRAAEELARRYTERVLAETDRAGRDPRDRLAAYVRESIDAAATRHSVTQVGELPPQTRDRLAELDDDLVRPLACIARTRGGDEAAAGAALGLGVVQAAVGLVERGADPEVAKQRALTFLDAALG